MFHLSLRERVEVARFVKRRARVPVIASGHVSWAIDDQIDELNRVAGTGVNGVVLIAYRLAHEQDRSECGRTTCTACRTSWTVLCP